MPQSSKHEFKLGHYQKFAVELQLCFYDGINRKLVDIQHVTFP